MRRCGGGAPSFEKRSFRCALCGKKHAEPSEPSLVAVCSRELQSGSGLTTAGDGGHHKIETNMLRPTLGLLLHTIGSSPTFIPLQSDHCHIEIIHHAVIKHAVAGFVIHCAAYQIERLFILAIQMGFVEPSLRKRRTLTHFLFTFKSDMISYLF